MFTQPCFIRKNTKELIKELEELGYSKNSPSQTDKCSIIWCYQYSNEKGFDTPCYVIANSFYIPFDKDSSFCGKFIDCGTNEELFLAIAALRDDSDYMQYFVSDNDPEMFLLCCYKEFHCFGIDPGNAFNYCDYKDEFHKATVEELIEHFKK